MLDKLGRGFLTRDGVKEKGTLFVDQQTKIYVFMVDGTNMEKQFRWPGSTMSKHRNFSYMIGPLNKAGGWQQAEFTPIDAF